MKAGVPEVLVADTGSCNIASVLAALERAGASAIPTRDARAIAEAEFAVLPGVGSFGPVATRLDATGIGAAFSSRVAVGKPTLGICLGMQLFFNSSDESPGFRGLSALPGSVTGYGPELRSPQFGWNRVSCGGPVVSEPGWAYFANSYKLDRAPAGWSSSVSTYGSPFVASLERGSVVLCQFHPELSGAWGLRILKRWLQPARDGATAALAVRIIPCLDIDGGRVVKGVRFSGMRDAGDPVELAERYEKDGADELAILDIGAGRERRGPAVEVIKRIRGKVGIPLCVGGGIVGLKDAAALLGSGADKVSLNSAAYRDPSLIAAIAGEYGRQCCVVAIDAARDPGGVARVHLDAGRTPTGEAAVDWARRAVRFGAGEILLTSKDRDGTGLGYDVALVSEVSKAVPGTPVIASGGASTAGQLLEGVRSGASALLLAGALHDKSLSIGDVKSFLRLNGSEVRIC